MAAELNPCFREAGWLPVIFTLAWKYSNYWCQDTSDLSLDNRPDPTELSKQQPQGHLHQINHLHFICMLSVVLTTSAGETGFISTLTWMHIKLCPTLHPPVHTRGCFMATLRKELLRLSVDSCLDFSFCFCMHVFHIFCLQRPVLLHG